MSVAATCLLDDAAKQTWDILVVGAGPAGATVAFDLARRGNSVLLVDRASFPRWKVCGSCLLEPGLRQLRQLGLGELPELRQAVPLTEARLSARGRHVRIPLSGGVAISREALDAALIRAAIEAGTQFLPSTTARLRQTQSSFREVLLQQTGESHVARAKVVIAADGLAGQFSSAEPGQSIRIDKASRLGAGCVYESCAGTTPPGVVEMACGRAGYVGLVRVEDGRMNCAAALDYTAIRQSDGPGAVATSILSEADVDHSSALLRASWRGTPALTRSISRPWGERLFVLGDAAGYVEPFTGEGMSLALGSAVALAPLADRAVREWDTSLGPRWKLEHRRVTRPNQFLIRAASMLLRYPRLAGWMVSALTIRPGWAEPVERRLNRSIPVPNPQ